MIKTLLIEDHEIIRDGIETLLEKIVDIQLIGSTQSGRVGIQMARDTFPDVVLLDHELPDSNGLEVTRKLLQYTPEIKILIITANKSDALALKFLEAGAAGYLSKDYGFQVLEAAIRKVNNGQCYISPNMEGQLARRQVKKSDANSPFDALSPKEMDVSIRIASGYTPDDIADQMNLAKKTVHSYRYRIFEKLAIKNDLELLRLALKHHIVQLEGSPPT